ncbi:parallel beta-helix domain-containing protein [Leptospira terpstrae]|uniref:Parallel beta-helix repeat-containing protein n=1 Tax=Leptospira terpstrae serovar Hualin str. LT 11-33 = ATCC 700639 TaxID=1257025 RepID=N1VJQ8_9LEPT|nr:parallel beta-helix domain-containing protein [Leptospira terpstrae]EMY59974.1 parallel beta-helix repeat-containing protein [Leptospira terpstrae serovar Hualin str. LT 11-33 = ATCC 700639]
MSFKKLFKNFYFFLNRKNTYQQIIVICFLFFLSSQIFSRTVEVHEGESIQNAIDSLEKGDIVKVFPGVYHEFLFVDKTHFTLSGVIVNGKWPILDGEGILNDGVIGSGANFIIENFHIKNYKANGVMTQGAGNIIMRKLIVDNTGIYGIYPTMGTNILIEDTVSLGIADAAIYIGMCHNVDVRRNEVYGSVIGIEIENSTNVLIEGNTVYDNSAGIVAFALPGLPLKKVENVIIRRNFIFDNNHRNFAEPGALVAGVPPGIGIGVMAGDEVTIEGNIIRRNSFAGIGIGDNNLLPNSKSPDPDVEPNPDRNKVLENVFIDNGIRKWDDIVSWLFYVIRIIFSGNPIPESPNGGKVGIFPDGFDIVASGKGKDNCLSSPDSVTKIGTSSYGICSKTENTEKVKTMIGDPKQGEAKSDVRELGKQVFGAVCSGCHSMTLRTVGPPIKEIQEKYKKDVYGVVTFASMPKKVREGFIEMPSQKYLGNEKLTAVSNYILNLKDEGAKGVVK